MNLADARLCVMVGPEMEEHRLLEDSRAWLRAGADIVDFNPGARPAADALGLMRELRELCREEGALLVGCDCPHLVREAGADGLRVTDVMGTMGEARAAAGLGRLMGLTVVSGSQAVLGMALEADYLVMAVHPAEVWDIPPLRERMTIPFFAPSPDAETAAALMAAGVLRFWVPARAGAGEEITRELAAIARAMGREV